MNISGAIACSLLLTAILFFPAPYSAQTGVFINEFMASNGFTLADEDGDFEDWIELYNHSDDTVTVEGYYLSDSDSNPYQWRFPSVSMAPRSFLLVFASGKNRTEGELHTNFKISSEGEPLLLSDPDGNLLDHIPPASLGRDLSYGRLPDGGADFETFERPSPGAPNLPNFELSLTWSHPSGFYDDTLSLEVIVPGENEIEIYFTINGDLPGSDDSLLLSSIELLPTEVLENNPIIEIPTNSSSSPPWYRWRPPGDDLPRAHVVRAAGFKDGEPVTDVLTGTFFVGSEYFTHLELPVFSLVLEEGDLFDHYRGLFVPGNSYDENPWEGAWSGGNFHKRGREWERETHLFYFDEAFEKQLDQKTGIRIHGGGSRSMPSKSIRLYARSYYGEDRIRHDFFEEGPNEYHRLLLRNSGQDFVRTMYIDGLTHLIVAPMGFEQQRYRPAILFINGAYWGLINIRDRIDKYYFQSHLGVDEDHLDLLEFGGFTIVEGERDDYLEMMEYVRNHSLEEEMHFRMVEEWMDVENFIDYYIAKMFIATYDWPGNNIRFWRDRSENGKWRWVYFDNDDALADLYFNPYNHLMDSTNNPWPNPLWSTELFRNLMESEIFRSRFVNAINRHLADTFDPERTISLAIETANSLRTEMSHHIERWGFPESVDQWEQFNMEVLEFLGSRSCVFLEMSKEFFGEDYQFDSLGYCISYVKDEANENSIQLMPNPTRNHLHVVADIPLSIQSYTIVNAAGKQISQKRVTHSSETGEKYKVDVSGLAPGWYLLELVLNKGMREYFPFVKTD
ncbi:MAG: hypothetical protein EA409_13375 [Saprospirales bacterium]|nr:MAG: hypothetical protein EA409_13375 [Saprospirales bacterium]